MSSKGSVPESLWQRKIAKEKVTNGIKNDLIKSRPDNDRNSTDENEPSHSNKAGLWKVIHTDKDIVLGEQNG